MAQSLLTVLLGLAIHTLPLALNLKGPVLWRCHPDRSEPVFSCMRFVHAGSRSGGIAASLQPFLAPSLLLVLLGLPCSWVSLSLNC